MDSFGVVILRGVSAVWPKEGRTVRRHNDRDKILSFMGERGSLGMIVFISGTNDGASKFARVDFSGKRYRDDARGV
jgi:hypothetical protein